MHYIDSHPLHGAFVANKLDRLSELIVEQGNALLRDAGVDIPSRTVSLLLLIGVRGDMSIADIAATFGQPHQLVTQRIDLLIDLALIERRADPDDGRRKLLCLTAKGLAHHAALQIMLARAAEAFAGLSDEIGCDLGAVALRAIHALDRTPLIDRVREASEAGDKQATVR